MKMQQPGALTSLYETTAQVGREVTSKSVRLQERCNTREILLVSSSINQLMTDDLLL